MLAIAIAVVVWQIRSLWFKLHPEKDKRIKFSRRLAKRPRSRQLALPRDRERPRSRKRKPRSWRAQICCRTFLRRVEIQYSYIRIATPMLAMVLSACATTPVYEGRLPWREGWREGVVEAVGDSDHLKSRYRQSCSTEAPMRTTDLLARVRWRQVGHARWWTVVVPQGTELKVGDAVYVNVASCMDAVHPRAPQLRSGVSSG